MSYQKGFLFEPMLRVWIWTLLCKQRGGGWGAIREFKASKQCDQKLYFRISCCGSEDTNPTSIHDGADSITGLAAQWVREPVFL